MLHACSHGAFPVVILTRGPEDPAKRPLAGLVLREHVAALLAHRRDGRDDRRDRALSTAQDGTARRRLRDDWRRGRSPSTWDRSWCGRPSWYADCPLSRAYRLFVTMGLRHLVVVSHEDNSVAGVVTRADLAGCLHS